MPLMRSDAYPYALRASMPACPRRRDQPMSNLCSIIIASHNRDRQLDRCLTSIGQDTSGPDREVIVVNNASTDDTAGVLSHHNVTPLTLDAVGKCRALNYGLQASRGAVIAFTDDDVTVDPGWCAALTAPFSDTTIDAVGGRILPCVDGTLPSWLNPAAPLFHPLLLYDYGDAPFVMTRERYPIGANMAIRRKRLPADPFNVRLGHTGRAALGFEEWELFDRLRLSNITYAPDAIVTHWVDSARLTFPAVRRKLFQFGVGSARYHNLTNPLPSRCRRTGDVVRAAGRMARTYRRTRADGLTPVTAEAELAAARFAGGALDTFFASSPAVAPWLSTKL